MATIKQKKALEALVENGGNVSKAMKSAGYRNATAKTPQKLTESKGFQELANELGLTKDLLIRALVKNIKTKSNNTEDIKLGLKATGNLTDKIEIGGEIDFQVVDYEKQK